MYHARYDACELPIDNADSSELHPPAVDRAPFNQTEQTVHGDSNPNHSKQPGKDVGNLQLILVLIDKPADAAGTGTDSENQFGRDQSAPGKGPAVLESGQDGREGRRYENL